MRTLKRLLPAFVLLSCSLAASTASAADIKLLLPLGRTAYQTNEVIDLAVVRGAGRPASELLLTLAGTDGSRFEAAFPATRAVEHLHLNGWLLRPGKYTIEVRADGGDAHADIDVYGHLRKSDFRLINWGRATKPEEQRVQGEDGFGYNLIYGSYTQDEKADYIRAGVDFMGNCVMSGAHQMDLRMECDWSDPYVTRGGTVRVVRRAFQDRTRGNVPGVHFYDEPGLTWWKHPKTGEMTPHGIPAQMRSYLAAFDREAPDFLKLDPKNPEDVARWRQWAQWKLGFMDAAWKEAQFGVAQVRPDYLSVTQSQYGWSAFTDGYYFNVVRSLPVTSGHGGYDDYGPAYFNPSYTLEMARARDFDKPCWYLPTWYGNTPPDRFRLEQYLSFQTGIQGMMSPPDLEPATNPVARQGIVETNHLFQKLGPIFVAQPPTKPPVALLYSLSQAIHTQTKDRDANYAHAMPQGITLPLVYLAGKLLQQQFLAVIEEDVLDGTLANDHKAVVLSSVDYLDAKVIRALEEFASNGGLVLMTGDSTVSIRGAHKLDVKPRMPDQEKIDELVKAKKYNDLGPYQTMGKYFEAAAPIAKAIDAELKKAGIHPPVESDVPAITVTRQASGDVEYLFAVNASYDASKGDKHSQMAADATLSFAREGGPIYDAVLGGPVALKAGGDRPSGKFRFGPGQMRVFARTARPLGGVKIATPVLRRELTRDEAPIRVEIAAVVSDSAGGILAGSIPLHVRLIDPLGVTRHELYRATRQGQLALSLPLAANDPAGKWKLAIRELLNNGEATAEFAYTPPVRVRSLAGATERAVVWGNDRDNVFRFARLHRQVTIVKGNAPYHAAAAERLTKVLDPWGVKCKTVDVAAAAKPRAISEEEAKTWVGLGFGKVKPGADHPPIQTGFAIEGHVILLGNAEDNAIIKYLQENKFLPYTPQAGTFPGPGRGMVAWQRDGVGHGQESVTLIAHDAEGLSEAVGTFYEAIAGLNPLTRWELADRDSLTPAKTAPDLHPAAAVAWTLNLTDRVDGISVEKRGVLVLTHDGSLTPLTADGKPAAAEAHSADETEKMRKELTAGLEPKSPAAQKQARPDRLLKLAAAKGDRLAVAYWGGTLRVADGAGKILSEQQMPQDVTALAWVGSRLIAGLADGRVVALDVR
jgi:hypothetical protein